MIKKLHFFLALLTLMMLTISTSFAAEDITIVQNGKSTFTIVTPQKAQSALTIAVREMAKCIHLATNAKLTIQSDDKEITTPYISVGNTTLLDSSGIRRSNLPDEAFQITTHLGNIFIYGIDTAPGSSTKNGGTSNGSANGVYSFLERYLDVRWLMPGELGRDVPVKSTFSVPEIDYSETPGFLNRRLPYIQDSAAVREWTKRQKLGYSFNIQHGHNWVETITPDYYLKHPDWFAMIDGKRQQPAGHYKLETTNPEVIRFFVDKAIETLKKNSRQNTFSLSPSDYSTGWSQSPESLPYYEILPNGETSVTPLILKFYNDVAKNVAKEYPEGKLAGYIYSDYLYPPQKGNFSLPDNFYPVIAPSINYGYQLYRPDVQKDFDSLMSSWSKITDNLFYYDLPVYLWSVDSKNGGIITPIAPEILNFLFPRLVKYNVKGVYIYGNQAWSQAAISNYILAKMFWNPQLDAYQLKQEWLNRAYGQQAAPIISELYEKLDQWFRAYHLKYKGSSAQRKGPLFKEVYAPNYPQIEKFILDAERSEMTPVQRRRFELLENNIKVLHWRLSELNLLPAGFQSAWNINEKDILEILTKTNADYDLYPGLVDTGPKVPRVDVSLGKSTFEANPENTLSVRNKNRILLYCSKDATVTINPIRVSVVKPFLNYAIKDQNDQPVKAGVLQKDQVIQFEGKANHSYFLYIPKGIFRLSIKGAAAAYQSNLYYDRLHVMGKSTLYVYNPSNVKEWKFTISSASPGETASVRVTAPNGEVRATLDTVDSKVDSAVLQGMEGFWKIEAEKASKGVIDDVYLTFDDALPQWISLDPEQPLIVR